MPACLPVLVVVTSAGGGVGHSATLHLAARSARPQGSPVQAVGFLVNHTAGPNVHVDLPVSTCIQQLASNNRPTTRIVLFS